MNYGSDGQTEPDWQPAAEVSVDSGYVMLSDPVIGSAMNLTDPQQPEDTAWTWARMVELLVAGWPEEPLRAVTQLRFRAGHPGLA
jgi:hypothetical protein